ncbi:TlpA family protein disulfide reductase [bacterium]|nr:TlpA family protein disulfide reductase [bacterium]
MKNIHKKIIWITALLSILITTGCGSGDERTEKAENIRKLPEFSLENDNGQKYTQKNFRDNVGIISFVASWCGPCGVELTELDSIAQKYSEIIALAVTYEPPEFYRELIDSLKIKVPIFQADSSFFVSMGVSKLPTRMLIKDGYIISQVVGAPISKNSTFEDKLKDALGIKEADGDSSNSADNR